MKTESARQDKNSMEYGLALLTFIGVSLLNLFLKRWIGYQAIALVYLLAVVLLALFVGRGPILLGTALTALGWGYLFAPPLYSFSIGSPYDKMMFAMYFVVALTVAQLTARLREEQVAERKREEHSRALYLFTRELADARDQADIMKRVVSQLGDAFNADFALVIPSSKGDTTGAVTGTWSLTDRERGLADEAINTNKPVGLPSVVANTNGIYLPLSAGGGPMGALAVRQKPTEEFGREQVELLENLTKQTALVLDRQRLRDAEIKTQLLAESERLGRTLLNSVSHELRTPLAAIATAVGTLRDSGQLSPLQAKLSSEIDSAIFRLNRVVQSLLSATRIQSGQVSPKMDWCDLADVVRGALLESGAVLQSHRIEREIQPGLPLVRGDSVLLQQALLNLLVNAAIYTPKGTTVQITAEVTGSEAVIRVSDSGPGLPPNQLDRVFELFHRLPDSKPGGTGLGLAIVKGFVEAQGGRVQASNRPGNGAEFSIFLPVHEAPQLTEERA